jgi:hypothetical protein
MRGKNNSEVEDGAKMWKLFLKKIQKYCSRRWGQNVEIIYKKDTKIL